VENETASHIRRVILQQAHRAHVGHIGSALCIADILAALYWGGADILAPDHPGRDRVVFSKGHAALALYAVLRLKGWISQEELDSYCADGSALGVHPDRFVRGVDFSTGSLGLGLSMAAGAALAARLQGAQRHVFALLSDAECNEGAVWEAAMFAAHHRLSNLSAVIDLNGQQALGRTRDVLDMSPMGSKWSAFGWDVREVDGHDAEDLRLALERPGVDAAKPRVIIAKTVFGKGVPFMEGQLRWHYMPMTDDEYLRALAGLEAPR
jgi:transketolase